MANPEHLKILNQGVRAWNMWREDNPDVKPDLSNVELTTKDFTGINLRNADCSKTYFRCIEFNDADLISANFRKCKCLSTNFLSATLANSLFEECDITGSAFSRSNLDSIRFSNSKFFRADFFNANLSFADFSGCTITQSIFEKSFLSGADLKHTEIRACNFERANLVEADFTNAKITDSQVFGISSWKIKREGIFQRNLKITPLDEPNITVDDIDVAQFIYLLLNNQNLRNIIDTITSKAVLILGRFTEERKQVLDAIKDELRRQNYLPIVFDFEPSPNRNLTETVSILAKMSRFVIADLTDPRSIPQELCAIVPTTPLLPIVPIILDTQPEYSLFESIMDHHSVLPICRYQSPAALLQNIVSAIIQPAEEKLEDLRSRRK